MLKLNIYDIGYCLMFNIKIYVVVKI